MRDEFSLGSFIIGSLVMFMLLMFLTTTVLDLKEPYGLIANKALHYDGIKYNITIDTMASDSLYGKTWRIK